MKKWGLLVCMAPLAVFASMETAGAPIVQSASVQTSNIIKEPTQGQRQEQTLLVDEDSGFDAEITWMSDEFQDVDDVEDATISTQFDHAQIDEKIASSAMLALSSDEVDDFENDDDFDFEPSYRGKDKLASRPKIVERSVKEPVRKKVASSATGRSIEAKKGEAKKSSQQAPKAARSGQKSAKKSAATSDSSRFEKHGKNRSSNKSSHRALSDDSEDADEDADDRYEDDEAKPSPQKKKKSQGNGQGQKYKNRQNAYAERSERVKKSPSVQAKKGQSSALQKKQAQRSQAKNVSSMPKNSKRLAAKESHSKSPVKPRSQAADVQSKRSAQNHVVEKRSQGKRDSTRSYEERQTRQDSRAKAHSGKRPVRK